MNKITKIAGAVAIAAVIAAGSSAFTAGGLKSSAGDSVSLGGTITQAITGELTVSGITYDYDNDNTGNVTAMNVTFGVAPGARVVTATFNGQAAVTCTHAVGDVIAICTPAAPLDLNAVTVTVV